MLQLAGCLDKRLEMEHIDVVTAFLILRQIS